MSSCIYGYKIEVINHKLFMSEKEVQNVKMEVSDSLIKLNDIEFEYHILYDDSYVDYDDPVREQCRDDENKYLVIGEYAPCMKNIIETRTKLIVNMKTLTGLEIEPKHYTGLSFLTHEEANFVRRLFEECPIVKDAEIFLRKSFISKHDADKLIEFTERRHKIRKT